MIVIEFLLFLLKVSALVFVIGILINLILDVVIIQPLWNRKANKKKLELFDVIIEKAKNGEIVTEDMVEDLEEEIED